MGKSMYSIILSDEVVDAVDSAAYKYGVSRSGLIDRILAGYLSCPIPEIRIEDTLSQMEKILSGLENFHLNYRPHCSVFSVQSALRYRYKPTVRYALELYRQAGDSIGELRVSLRTQNRSLICALTDFFSIWDGIENRFIGSRFPGSRVPCSLSDGKYVRQLAMPAEKADRTNEKVADAISSYICELDAMLKLYFECAGTTPDTAGELARRYRLDMEGQIII